ncbi:MAG: putative ABC transporter ATP-binding protein [Candidatus Dichloromethanomonas elyunquensis]|nr:MAG: putative ABC transporter ATP-binding protein [Candidatus Dichloromethanomonas elyunquensis]
MNPLIRAHALSKTYQMGEIEVKALRNVDFEIYDNEFIVILGPSGSGKSTLLNIVGGMDRASGGELYYKDIPLHSADSEHLTLYRRNVVGFVFQFYNLIPNLNACENISLSAEIAPNPLSVGETLARVGLAERAGHFPSQMSGGEQQRIALARAIVKNPELLLCDEPTGALDSQTSIQVLKILKDFHENYRKTVIIITHNAGVAAIANRVFYIKDGGISRITVNDCPTSPEKVTW